MEELVRIVPELIDGRVGLIREVREIRLEAGSPNFFHFSATACDTSAFTHLRNFASTGGASVDRGLAAAKAIGEAVERYCAAIFDVAELPLCSFADAPFECVPPSQFTLYSDAQHADPDFPWVPFGPNTRVRWAPAEDLTTGRECHVPAARVFIPYVFDLGIGDSPIDQPISTGLACHIGKARAAIAAACEVIERDAFTITWQAMLSPPKIRPETLSDVNQDLVGRFRRTGSEVCLFDITMDHGIPTILSVLRNDRPSAPALVVAAQCAPDAEDAVRKSLEELAHTRRYCEIIKTHLPRIVPAPPDHGNVEDQRDHLNFWSDQQNLPLVDWLLRSERRIDFENVQSLPSGDPANRLELIADRLRSVDERLLVANVTTPDVAALGLTVVRAIVPGFHPLHMGHRLRALGGRRVWEVPQIQGYAGIAPESGDNPWPHPYP